MRTVTVALASSIVFAAEPIPEDRGAAGLHQALKQIENPIRVLSVTAHPDDEDAGTLTMLARGRGASVTMLILNRGESGANLISGDFFEGLGALRTGEMLKAAQYYGAEVRFKRFFDFGFSKTLEETFQNWDREEVLRDCVRAVRQVRPHVIVSRFQGTARDGHGNHQAAGLLAQLMFDAAADAKRFPELGLPAWQARKLYLGGWRDGEAWTIAADSGEYDPVLGRSYAQIGREGYRWHRSQGMALSVARPGPAIAYYKLAKSTVGMADKENDFFERLNIPAGPKIRQCWPDRCAAPLAELIAKARRENDAELEGKATRALMLALGVELEALVEPENPPSGPFAAFRAVETLSVVAPGAKFRMSVTPHIRGKERVEVLDKSIRTLTDQPTRAYWRRTGIRDTSYAIDEAQFGNPLPPWPHVGFAKLRYAGVEFEATSPVMASVIDPVSGQSRRPLVNGPAVAVSFAAPSGVLPLGGAEYRVSVTIRNLVRGPVKGALRLETVSGANIRVAPKDFTLERFGEEATLAFAIPAARSALTIIEAIAAVDGREYRDDFRAIGQPGTDYVYLAPPAKHLIREVAVEVSKNLRVGYVMGTGDSVPSAFEQLGVPYDLLSAETIASGDLSRYSTIVLGIRAYAARPELRKHNARLLDYVAKGGVLVVQYNTQEYDGNFGPYPYQMTARAEEISEEDAPVEILDPSDPVFQRPNKIDSHDFHGWIEQRGSKFLSMWDSRYKPLLASNDAGQAPQRGGWLVARHGQGLYIYCAYSWYRQIPYAVPGAFRIFANLISLGDPDAPWRKTTP
jgi:LmbE family N-acetylglucosaminyl deacetylase